MLEKGDKFFRIKVGNREQVVTVDRLKPAFGFADPTPPAAEKKREFKAAAPKEIKRSLDPEARIFVPGSGPKEKFPAVSRSKFGRTRRPPERLGIEAGQ